MIIIYTRSSSFSTYAMCEHKYYLEYVLGVPSKANQAAEKGTIVHKALELLAQRKLAEQRGVTTVKNEELNKEFSVADINPDMAIQLAWNHYVEQERYIYTDKDFEDCKQGMWNALFYKEGMFNPLKLNVVAPEQFFDITIERPWAKYHYNLDGKDINGYLNIKGTIDLVTEPKPGIIEIVDWKTGKKFNWNTFQDKTYEDICSDFQFRLYHYAACQLYPNAKEIFLTVFYLNHGGPDSICFTRKDMEQTEEIIRKKFNEIRQNKVPRLVYPSKKCSFCHYFKNSFDGATRNYKESICNVVHNEILTLGMDKVTDARCNKESLNKYSGGGRTHDSG